MKNNQAIETEKSMYSLNDALMFLQSLSPEQLSQPMRVSFEDCPTQEILGGDQLTEDIYYDKDNDEDVGTLADHESKCDVNEYNVNNYIPCGKKGDVFFY